MAEYEVLEPGGHRHLIDGVRGLISDAVSSTAKPAGSVSFANIPSLGAGVLGHVWNVTDDFTTDSRFVEGAGKKLPAGTNVWCVNVGTEESPTYKLDVFAGMIPDATTTTSGAMSAADKSKLDGIEASANAYVLPTMSPTTKGGAKVGAGLRMDGEALEATHDMGVTGAGVGQVLVVTSVDENGVPTSWGVASMASRVLTVTVTTHDAQTVTGQTVTVREGDGTGEVVAHGTYAGTPMAFALPVGLHYHVSVTDALRMYGPPSVATGTIGESDVSVTLTYASLNSVLEKDSGTGRYTNASLSEWMRRQRDGLTYGISQPKSTATISTKTGANANVADPVPSTFAQVGSDPYQTDKLGPFIYHVVNGGCDDDGTPYVTKIRGIDDDFALDGTTGDVFTMCPVLWESYDWSGDTVRFDVSDTEKTGLAIQPGGLLPDGTQRPYMLYAKYAGGMYGGAYASVSGVMPRNRDVSHNSLITITNSATTGYSGKSIPDDWYIKAMGMLKYSNIDLQTYMQGCTSYNLSYPVTVAESGVTRVIIAKSNAANLLVGSTVTLGSTDHSNSVFGETSILSIEDYDASNSAVNLDTSTTFTTGVGQKLSTSPWKTGATDGIVFDGSPTSNSSGKEPYVLQGIECAVGFTEILSGVIINSDGSTDWIPFVVHDTQDDATSLTADFVSTGAALPMKDTDAWRYPLYPEEHDGLMFGTSTGGSTTSGLADGYYVNKTVTTGTREWRSVGFLWNVRNAGPFCVIADRELGGAYWGIGGRLSVNGRSRSAA